MAVTRDNPGPYAPASAILEIISKYRSRGMQTPITDEVLGRSGISDSLIPRTLQALRTLELIGENGMPTEALENLRLAPEPEFTNALAGWIRAVYADALSFIDPADSEEAIRDAFRSYNPIGQQSRMVSLFLGLCRAAGMRSDEARSEARPRQRARRPAAMPSGGPARRPRQSAPPKVPKGTQQQTDLPPAIAGLLSSLPVGGGGWSKSERNRFLTTFTAVLDFCIPVVEPDNETSE